MVKNINIKKRSRENMGIFNLNSLKMFLPNTKKKSNAKNNNVSVPLVLKKKKNRYSYELCKKSNRFIKTNKKKNLK